jgi:hypothetical protein
MVNNTNDKLSVNSPYVLGGLVILMFMYYSDARAQLPITMTNLFKNDIFRVVFLALLLIPQLNESIYMSILIAVVFVLVMNRILIDETKENVEHFVLSWDKIIN